MRQKLTFSSTVLNILEAKTYLTAVPLPPPMGTALLRATRSHSWTPAHTHHLALSAPAGSFPLQGWCLNMLHLLN